VDFLSEGQDGMCNILEVRWTLTPKIAPRPWIACRQCGASKPFRSSGKIRLNANGRKLDAWLIYKCVACDNTWKRTLLERSDVRDIQPAILEALQSNDPYWIRERAFDVADLKRTTQRVDEFTEVNVQKKALSRAAEHNSLHICLSVPFSTRVRLERLLASELGLTRSRVRALQQASKLRVDPDRRNALRRPPKQGMRIILDLVDETDRRAIEFAASGTSST
jgi:hypothetical protein